VRRQPHTSEPAQYRETRKPPRNQSYSGCDLSKSTEIWLPKSAILSATYEIRTESAKHVEMRRLASNTPGLPRRPRVPDLLFLQLALDGLDLLGECPVIAD